MTGHRGWGPGASAGSGRGVVLCIGPIPIDKPCVLHECDNPPCVNPYHLKVGTAKENAEDRTNRGRQARGDRNGQTKIPDIDIPKIFADRAAGLLHREIAEKYGVSHQNITRILNKQTRIIYKKKEENNV